MQEPTISPERLETWADYLIDHSLGGASAFERVMIKGERICWPLMAVLEEKLIRAGALPDVCLVPPNNERGRVWSAAMGRHGGPEQLARVPEWHALRYDAMDKYIEVLGAEDPSNYCGLAPDQAGALATADAPFFTKRLSKNWVITLFPTPAMAALEEMDLAEYTEFIVRASTTDPRPLQAAEERIAPLIERGRRLVLATEHPANGRPLELSMSIAESRPTMSYGLRNFPDGEVFTSPDASSCEGEVFVDLPVHHGGVDIRGIHLVLEGGRIVEYCAEEGGEQLEAIIETDEGSHRLGEVALGMNPGLDRVLKHPLFVEKVGGTAHIAIGASYPGCFVDDPESSKGKARAERLFERGVLNRSAQHVDIVVDYRPGGCGRSVTIDGKPLAVEGGVWVPTE